MEGFIIDRMTSWVVPSLCVSSTEFTDTDVISIVHIFSYLFVNWVNSIPTDSMTSSS